MTVYRIVKNGTSHSLQHISELDNVLQYSGSSIRITGNRGIRIIFNPKTETEEYHFSGRGTVLFDEHGRCERPVQDWLVAAPVSVIVMRME